MNDPGTIEQQRPAQELGPKTYPGPVSSTLRTVDLPLRGGATLRISSTGDSLILAPGFGGAGSDTPFHRPAWGAPPLTLPARILPELLDALHALDVPEEVEP